jgi:hypothetical protein
MSPIKICNMNNWPYRIADRWRETWLSNVPVNDPFAVPPRFDLKRQKWIILNRFHTSQCNYVYLMHRWGYSDSPVCDCGFAQQTTTHFFDCLLIILHHDVNENPIPLSSFSVPPTSFLFFGTTHSWVLCTLVSCTLLCQLIWNACSSFNLFLFLTSLVSFSCTCLSVLFCAPSNHYFGCCFVLGEFFLVKIYQDCPDCPV